METRGRGAILSFGRGWNMLQDREAPRPTVSAFARVMERALRENAHKGHWGDCSIEYLLRRLMNEIAELRCALQQREPAEVIQGEAADAANFLMMIADNYSPRPTERKTDDPT